ncbi:MAG: DUF4434 domain-containing protein [Lentisphaeria bacterium]|nr:DUF4434 domain-containing protein [Lentisphaeria bacterium]
MHITGTFLDEISWDIPHQNWGEKEWDADFAAMKAIGIDTVIMIRSGLRRFMTYPSEVLAKRKGCYTPPVDLVELYLRLAEKYGMTFYFGTYDGNNWHPETVKEEIAYLPEPPKMNINIFNAALPAGDFLLKLSAAEKVFYLRFL